MCVCVRVCVCVCVCVCIAHILRGQAQEFVESGLTLHIVTEKMKRTLRGIHTGKK